jgi:hypothetical protein
MSTAIVIAINIALAATALVTIAGLLAASIATAPAARGVTLVRRAHRPRFEWARSRPAPPPVARA